MLRSDATDSTLSDWPLFVLAVSLTTTLASKYFGSVVAELRPDVDFETMSGIPLDQVYGPADAEQPGEWPFTRGIHASMYRSRLWTMRQFAGFGTAEDTNGRFKEILRAGGDGLSTAFDMPTLLGRDSDDPMS